jgi:hypothetical protein
MPTGRQGEQKETVMDDQEAAKGRKPVQEGEGEDGLGSKTGGLGGPDDAADQESGTSSGGAAEEGPVNGETSEPGGGDALGPTPDGVPQEGEVDPDADRSHDSTTG